MIECSYTFGFGWRPGGEPKITPMQIVREVAEKHRVSVADLRGQSRKRSIAWARQEAMCRLYRETAWSLPRIGQYFGGRDHTTARYGVLAYEARLRGEQPPRYGYRPGKKGRLEALERRLAHAAEQRGVSERVAA